VFSLSLSLFPDTIIVRAIGYRPDTTTLSVAPAEPLLIVLSPAAVELGDLVALDAGTNRLATGMGGTWVVAGQATASLPTAVEPDINRSLALIPAVSFSSLLSSRPMLRGLDSDDAGYAIDGFEAINLYHVGRFFSAVPALAIDRAEVQLQPLGAGIGGTTAGRVNIIGRRGEGAPEGEARYGLGAWSGAFRAGGTVPVFVAGRTAKFTFVDALQDGAESRYRFHDLYAHLTPNLAGRPVEVSLFTAADRVVGESDASKNIDNPSMDWTNLVVGGRSEVVNSARGSLTLSGSFARHTEESARVPARDTKLDVSNRFTRGGLALAGVRAVAGSTVFRFGGNLDARSITNNLQPSPGSEGPSVAMADRFVEGGLYAEVELRTGEVSITTGGRGTISDAVRSFEPRLQIRWSSGSAWWSVGAGRGTRTYHLLSDARSEPKLAYYDIWLPAGEDGIAVPRVSHFAAEYGRLIRHGEVRVGLFAARGSGATDLVPGIGFAAADSLFRTGESRVAGLDMNVSAAAPSGSWALLASYAMTVSERRWDDTWTAWVNGRQHQARIFGALRGGPSVRLSATGEWTSGAPYTPIVGWRDGANPGSPIPVYGIENSAIGSSLLRADVSLVKEWVGPWGSLVEAGFSVTNLSVGEQSPRRDELRTRFSQGAYSTSVRTKLLFDLPPVPSLNLRIRFGSKTGG
jgi:hypothetical protein